jgi:hypothetical protein
VFAQQPQITRTADRILGRLGNIIFALGRAIANVRILKQGTPGAK